MEIVRRPDRAEGGITDEERVALGEVAQEWIDIAMRTEPADPQEVEKAIKGLYKASGLKEPRVVLVPSPYAMAMAGGAASWLSHNDVSVSRIRFDWETNDEITRSLDRITDTDMVVSTMVGVGQVLNVSFLKEALNNSVAESARNLGADIEQSIDSETQKYALEATFIPVSDNLAPTDNIDMAVTLAIKGKASDIQGDAQLASLDSVDSAVFEEVMPATMHSVGPEAGVFSNSIFNGVHQALKDRKVNSGKVRIATDKNLHDTAKALQHGMDGDTESEAQDATGFAETYDEDFDSLGVAIGAAVISAIDLNIRDEMRAATSKAVDFHTEGGVGFNTDVPVFKAVYHVTQNPIESAVQDAVDASVPRQLDNGATKAYSEIGFATDGAMQSELYFYTKSLTDMPEQREVVLDALSKAVLIKIRNPSFIDVNSAAGLAALNETHALTYEVLNSTEGSGSLWPTLNQLNNDVDDEAAKAVDDTARSATSPKAFNPALYAASEATDSNTDAFLLTLLFHKVNDSAYSAAHSAVRDAIDSSIREAAEASVVESGDTADFALDDKVRQELYVTVLSKVTADINAAVVKASYTALSAASDNAARAPIQGLGSGISMLLATEQGEDRGALDFLPPDLREGAYECAKNWYQAYQGGNTWAGWCSYIAGCRDVLGLELEAFKKYQHWEDAAKCGGFRWMHEDFCIVSDFPEFIRVDDRNLPHCEDGPSHRWRDGWEIYSWHGTQIPKTWIVGDGPTISDAISHENVEMRRCASEIIGWDVVLTELNAHTIDKDPDPEIGELIEANLPDVGVERFLRVRCGTGRSFSLPVPPETETALSAQIWLNQWDDASDVPEVRT